MENIQISPNQKCNKSFPLAAPLFFFFSLPAPRGQFSLAFLNTVQLPPPPSWPSATACVYFKTLLVLLLLLPFTQQREASAHSYTLPHTHTHERFSQYSAGWCALLPSVFVGPNRSIDSCPGWNTTLETAAARWMFRLGAKLQMLRHSFFFFLACAAKKKKEKKNDWDFIPRRCHVIKKKEKKRKADFATCISGIDPPGNVKSTRPRTRVRFCCAHYGGSSSLACSFCEANELKRKKKRKRDKTLK